MFSSSCCQSLRAVRVGALLFPPAGLLLLWRSSQIHVGRKIFGTIGIAFYSLLYLSLVLFLATRICGLQIEFRGGMVPRFTFHKTLPDYSALEADRSRQKSDARTSVPYVLSVPSSAAAPWTGFRGPNRTGISDDQKFPTAWPVGGLRTLWRQPIGGGYSSFAVADGRAYTIEQRRRQEVVTAYDVQSGREIWAQGWDAEFQETLGGDGPRATPAFDQGRVYALGALGEFQCLDAATGHLLWRRNILDENGALELTYGTAASPLIVDDKVIVTPGGQRGRSVVAYHKISGEPLWKSLNDEAAYSSPMLVQLAGQRQLLIATQTRAVGLDVEDGKLLWEFPWVVLQNNRNIAQPLLLGTNRFLLSAGYGTGCVAVEVNRTARELWRNKLLKNKFTSSVFWNGFIYGLDEDILTCLDATTGARKWKDGRYGYGQLLLVNGHLIVLCGDGDLALVNAVPDRWEELARFPAIHGKTWNHPALWNGYLLVRNAAEMACFDLTNRD